MPMLLVNMGPFTSSLISGLLVETSVVAQDGETVVIGGMIQQTDQKNETKVPWLGDLPYVGTAFRYRTQVRMKREILVILTPRFAAVAIIR